MGERHEARESTVGVSRWSLRRSRRLHGYLRAVRDGPPSLVVEPVRARMVAYADAAGLVLDEVFVEGDDELGSIPSSVVSLLIASARSRHSVGVVVPSLAHLASTPTVRMAVKDFIEYRSGVPVVTLHPRSPWPPGPAGSDPDEPYGGRSDDDPGREDARWGR